MRCRRGRYFGIKRLERGGKTPSDLKKLKRNAAKRANVTFVEGTGIVLGGVQKRANELFVHPLKQFLKKPVKNALGALAGVGVAYCLNAGVRLAGYQEQLAQLAGVAASISFIRLLEKSAKTFFKAVGSYIEEKPEELKSHLKNTGERLADLTFSTPIYKRVIDYAENTGKGLFGNVFAKAESPKFDDLWLKRLKDCNENKISEIIQNARREKDERKRVKTLFEGVKNCLGFKKLPIKFEFLDLLDKEASENGGISLYLPKKNGVAFDYNLYKELNPSTCQTIEAFGGLFAQIWKACRCLTSKKTENKFYQLNGISGNDISGLKKGCKEIIEPGKEDDEIASAILLEIKDEASKNSPIKIIKEFFLGPNVHPHESMPTGTMDYFYNKCHWANHILNQKLKQEL